MTIHSGKSCVEIIKGNVETAIFLRDRNITVQLRRQVGKVACAGCIEKVPFALLASVRILKNRGIKTDCQIILRTVSDVGKRAFREVGVTS